METEGASPPSPQPIQDTSPPSTPPTTLTPDDVSMPQLRPYYSWIGLSPNAHVILYWSSPRNVARNSYVRLYAGQDKGKDDFLASTADFSVLKTTRGTTRGVTFRDIVIRSGLSTRYFLDDREVMRTTDLCLEALEKEDKTLEFGCWLTCSPTGFAMINWNHNQSQSGLRLLNDNDQVVENLFTDRNNSPYMTTIKYQPGLKLRYDEYFVPGTKGPVCRRRGKPVPRCFYDLQGMYVTPDSNYKQINDIGASDVSVNPIEIIGIAVDQLNRASKGEHSIFSFGYWPFTGRNLFLKNVSAEERQVVVEELGISDYYNVIMVYYRSYQMAIVIADDSERNAKRHAFWQISLVREFGEDIAKKLGDAHERGRPGTEEDNRVDDFNNTAAIAYAHKFPNKDPLTCANDMWTGGLLAGYEPAIEPEHTHDEL